MTLLVSPWVVALLLMRRHHHLDGGTVDILVALSLGLPTLWVTWAAYRGPRRTDAPASGLTMALVADHLAIAVGTQWEAEAAVRRLNDPYPLPIFWDPADVSLTDSWDSLVKLASSGAGWPVSPPAETWASGPDELAGKGGELAEVLDKVPTGRLVVLGEPGAGKTMLMVRLVLDLLARRAAGDPVPFLASIASWNPAEQELRHWLAALLLIDHPVLAKPPSADRTEPIQAAALLASGLILPILDGLDEIPDEVRGSAISRINDALRPGERVVVTCRSVPYQAAVRPRGGVEVTLRGAAAVQLRPLDADAVRDYLRDDALGPVARTRWAPVLARLGTRAPVGQALSTPLMVGLARLIYNPRPGELVGTLRDPAELCSAVLVDRTAVEAMLFDAFIPAAYRNTPASGWKEQDATRWLAFLACHLEYTINAPDLAWWQLRRSMTISVERIAVNFIERRFISSPMAIRHVPYVVTLDRLVSPQRRSPSGISSTATPKETLARSRRVATVTGAISGFLVGFLIGVMIGVFFGVAPGVVAGIATGMAAGLIRSFKGPWPWYTIARTRLALRHWLPWTLMSFLADAHRRGVLRQAGAVYQFRHIELQHRLANSTADKQQLLHALFESGALRRFFSDKT
jgi:hypothetical protein